MNEVTNWTFGETKVRTVEMNGVPWWVLSDVCKVLELNSPHKVADRLEEDERNQIPVTDSIGRQQLTTVINESGLYSVILRSDKPQAKPFRKWVTGEVLPTIRRTGSYGRKNEYDEKEVKDIITQEAARMLINISKRLGLDKQEPPKKDNSKLGRLSPENRKHVDKIIGKNTSYEQAAYEIRSVIGISISASAVRRYAKINGMR